MTSDKCYLCEFLQVWWATFQQVCVPLRAEDILLWLPSTIRQDASGNSCFICWLPWKHRLWQNWSRWGIFFHHGKQFYVTYSSSFIHKSKICGYFLRYIFGFLFLDIKVEIFQNITVHTTQSLPFTNVAAERFILKVWYFINIYSKLHLVFVSFLIQLEYPPDMPVFQLRLISAIFGSLLVPLTYQIAREAGLSQWAGLFAGGMILFGKHQISWRYHIPLCVYLIFCYCCAFVWEHQ